MLLQPDLGGRDQAMGNGTQPDFSVAMPAPVGGHGFQAPNGTSGKARHIDWQEIASACNFGEELSPALKRAIQLALMRLPAGYGKTEPPQEKAELAARVLNQVQAA